MNETWKEVPEYEGLYLVSDLGNVKSIKNNILLSKHLGKQGYYSVCLCKNNRKRTLPLHRLVVKAFLKNPEHKPFVNHKNLDKIDNRLDNLEWCTQRENMSHFHKSTGKKSSKFTGVYYCKHHKSWKSEISQDNTCHFLGSFKTEIDAHLMYEQKLKEYVDTGKITPVITVKKYSQHKGVCYDKRRNYWISNVRIEGKTIYIGSFKTEEDAIKAYEDKQKTLC
jgi:hypothetical protein